MPLQEAQNHQGSEMDVRENVHQLAKLIHGIKFAMLSTVASDGTVHSRPMCTQKDEFNGELWFFTAASSLKVFELTKNPNVNLSYSSVDDHRYVSVSGKAELLRDPEKAKQLWNPAYKIWFPQGLNDPDLALLRVRVDMAEYWKAPGSAVVQLLGFAKALMRNERYEAGEHATLHCLAQKEKTAAEQNAQELAAQVKDTHVA